MTRSSRLGFALLVLLLPSLVWAGPLDDYYLTRLAPAKSARLGTAAAPDGEGAGEAEHCLTMLFRSLKRDWDKLEPATQTTLAKLVSRPVLAGSFPSPGGHFTIHYATGGSDAPDPTDADQDQTPDWVEKVAEVFEQVYQAEVTSLGYRQPPGSRYDVYLTDLAAQNVYGYTYSDFTGSGVSSASYIEIDKAFTDTIYGSYTPEESLQVTAAHEYHHAIQFGYNYYFDSWYGEATATWIEDEVYDAVNQLYGYLDDYLPDAETLSLDAPLGGNSEYGRWIFNRHLAERHSRSLIRDIWARLGTTPAPANYSDIPMVPVIDEVLGDRGSSIGSEFSGMARKLYQKNWSSHPGDLDRIPALAPVATFSSYPLSSAAASGSLVTLPHYTFAYYRFLPSATAPATLKISVSGVANGTELVAFKKGTDGLITSYPLDLQTMSITIPSFNSAQTSEVRLLVSNGSAADGVRVGLAAVDSHTLTLSFAGTGTGSVNGSMSCLKGASCAPAQFADGSTVTLLATAGAGSLFGGWSGACSSTATGCQITMDASKTVTATFNAVPRLRIAGGQSYSLIASAYAAAANGAVIQAQATLFDDGPLILNRTVSVYFTGGYDAAFRERSGESTVKGKLLIRGGTVRVRGLTLR